MSSFKAFLLAALILVPAMAVVPAQAADAKPAASGASLSNIAIVDVERLIAQSKASQSIQKQLEAKKEALQKEFSQKDVELKKIETGLVAQKDKLSAEEFAKKRKDYEGKILETQKLYQKRRTSLDQGMAQAIQELRKAVAEASASVAEEKNIDIVLTRNSVLIAEKALDITDDVLKRLDGKVTNITLKVE